MDARTSKRQKKISQKQEARMARDLGGRAQPASGALKTAKSDVRTMGVVRGEAKFTAKDYYSLKREDMEKIVGEAGLEKAVLQLCFINRANKPTATFAIYPVKEMNLDWLYTDGETNLKSITLLRDRLSLRLMKTHQVLILFIKVQDGVETKQLYAISDWDWYVYWMEEQHA